MLGMAEARYLPASPFIEKTASGESGPFFSRTLWPTDARVHAVDSTAGNKLVVPRICDGRGCRQTGGKKRRLREKAEMHSRRANVLAQNGGAPGT